MKFCIKKFVIIVTVVFLSPAISTANSIDFSSRGAIGTGFVNDGLQLELVFQKTPTQSIHIALASNVLWDGSKGEEKDKQLSNYGRTVDGTGDGFYLFDIGWGYTFYSQFRLAAELTFAWEYEYTNYKDARFKDGGYHMVDDTEFQLGVGGTASYIINHRYELYSGYNSYKAFNAGMRFRF